MLSIKRLLRQLTYHHKWKLHLVWSTGDPDDRVLSEEWVCQRCGKVKRFDFERAVKEVRKWEQW